MFTRKALLWLGVFAAAALLAASAEAQETYEAADAVASDGSVDPGYVDSGYGAPACGHGNCGCGDCGCDGCGGCGCGDCGGCCTCCCDPCCRSQGFIFGAEVLWLKPHRSSGFGLEEQLRFNVLNNALEDFGEIDREDLADNPIDEFTVDYETSYRVWIGWQRCDGLGIRARYWQFDHSYRSGTNAPLDDETRVGIDDNGDPDGVDIDVFLNDDDNFAFTHEWDAWYLDVEITDSSKIGCNWDLTVSGGLRYVDYQEVAGLLDLGEGQGVFSQTRFTGIGATVAAEVRRQVTCNIGIFASARYSILMGDEDNTLFDTGGTPDGRLFSLTFTHRDEVRHIYELQAGTEYIVPICCGGYYFVRSGVELQYWDGFGVDNTPFVADGFDEQNFLSPLENDSVGFGGWFIAAGLQR